MRKSKEMRPGSPVYPTRVSTKGIDTRENLVESALITIRVGLMQFSMLQVNEAPEDTPPLVELSHTLDRVGGRVYEQLGIIFASDGYALHKLTKNGLVDHSHQLKVPTKAGDPEYSRFSFNVDPQCVGGSALKLVGLRAISRNSDAVVELLAFERDIVYESLVNVDRPIN